MYEFAPSERCFYLKRCNNRSDIAQVYSETQLSAARASYDLRLLAAGYVWNIERHRPQKPRPIPPAALKNSMSVDCPLSTFGEQPAGVLEMKNAIGYERSLIKRDRYVEETLEQHCRKCVNT